MSFTSIIYFEFILLIFLIYVATPYRFQNILLLIASYIFYAWWDSRFLALIGILTAVNYCCGLLIKAQELTFEQRLTVSFSVIFIVFFSLFIDFKILTDLDSLYSLKCTWKIFHDNKYKLLFFLAVFLNIVVLNLKFKNTKIHVGNKKKKLVVITAVTANLLILGFFKYYNFFIDNIELIIRSLNIDPSRFHLSIILPIGISFYTFKSISYIVDVYRNQLETEPNYINFSLYIAFFPSLLAGPLDRAKNLLEQFSIVRKQTIAGICEGLHLVIYGLFKKIAIADGIVRTVNSVFDSSGQPSWIDVVLATVFFTIQIYCDFSGYTDIARGTAKFFGIELMINFNLPYFSRNPREFWRRWHISLSSWLRDYLYIPLGGNRAGGIRTYRNLMLTMILGGLWHGASWNFIFWGFYHGLVLCLQRAYVALNGVTIIHRVPGITGIKIVFFFLVICYGWLLFRAPSLETVIGFSSILIFDFGNLDFGAMRPKAAALVGIILLACIEIIEYLYEGKPFYRKLPMPTWTALYSLIIFCLLLGLGNETAQFIYFKF
jgi:D-alanyl-lipoteichoic acid acyltransferase DltB (MBOAT superfamily)